MELRHLRTFISVAQTLNISESARRLHVTQPAVSRQIQSLEHTVGQPLFLRIPGRLKLTAAGQTLHEQGEKALVAVEDALRRTRAVAASESVPVRIGYFGTASIWSSLLAPAVEKLGGRFPRATSTVVELSCAQLVAELSAARLDLAVLGPGHYPVIPGVEVTVGCTLHGVAMVSVNHRLAKKRQISLDDLRDEEIVGTTEQSSPGRERGLISACKAAGFSPRITYTAVSLPSMVTEVTKRNALAVLGSLAPLVPYAGVVFVPFEPPGVPLQIHLARLTHLSPAASHLAELIMAKAQRVSPTH